MESPQASAGNLPLPNEIRARLLAAGHREAGDIYIHVRNARH